MGTSPMNASMTSNIAQRQAEPVPVVLPTPCWWIDRNDCWEISHHPTKQDAIDDHVAQVRSDYGMPLSEAGALAEHPGIPRQETRVCHAWECPECGSHSHTRDRWAECVDECGYAFTDTTVPLPA